MRELMRTNDPVLLSFVEALLGSAGMAVVILDQNMSVMEGSIGLLPRRVMVDDDDLPAARALLVDAELGDWLSREGGPA